jgi:TM2 domain-containing membrane protein YozV
MQGTILSYQPETNTGLISGHDGTRYKFAFANWTTPKVSPSEGITVDFDVDADDPKKAIDIVVIKSKSPSHVGGKKRGAAILWTFFLGWLGGHKFYLGETTAGIFYFLFSWTFIPAFIAFIEFIALILMSDEDFNRKYNY